MLPEPGFGVSVLRALRASACAPRSIAERWSVPAAGLHHACTLARQEFRAGLVEVVAFHHPGNLAEVEQEAASLLWALSLLFQNLSGIVARKRSLA
jgi:hypothetical protein